MAPWKQILVGVDGSPASRKALEWAGDEAVRHGSEIVALTAYQAPSPPLSFGTVSVHEAQSAGEAASKSAEQLLLETIRDVLGEDPRSSCSPG
jgi:nucleotide-binding universal stress UspA family protein